MQQANICRLKKPTAFSFCAILGAVKRTIWDYVECRMQSNENYYLEMKGFFWLLCVCGILNYTKIVLHHIFKSRVFWKRIFFTPALLLHIINMPMQCFIISIQLTFRTLTYCIRLRPSPVVHKHCLEFVMFRNNTRDQHNQYDSNSATELKGTGWSLNNKLLMCFIVWQKSFGFL